MPLERHIAMNEATSMFSLRRVSRMTAIGFVNSAVIDSFTTEHGIMLFEEIIIVLVGERTLQVVCYIANW